jgi:hypothetical protein
MTRFGSDGSQLRESWLLFSEISTVLVRSTVLSYVVQYTILLRTSSSIFDIQTPDLRKVMTYYSTVLTLLRTRTIRTLLLVSANNNRKMSGLIPDLASWALRGGAGNEDDNENDGNNDNNSDAPTGPPLTEQEMRARRLTRMEAMMSSQSADGDAMDVDSSSPKKASSKSSKAAASMEGSSRSPPKKKIASPKTTPLAKQQEQEDQPQRKRKKDTAKNSVTSPADSARKVQRKKELLIKKVLSVTLLQEDSACVLIQLDDADNIGVHTIAELLATRLSLSPSDIRTIPQQKPLILYLGQAHRKAGEELRTLRQSTKKDTTESQEILQEIQRQVVSYAASSLMEPDLFELAKDGVSQLAKALMDSSLDALSSITFGVNGSTSSFYYLLCEELFIQDKATLDKVLSTVTSQILVKLRICDSIDSGVGESSALALVSALTAMCQHKKAALAMTQMDNFLVPAEGTPQATEQIRPAMPAGADLLRMLAGENRPYQRRSGPGVEKQTLLGACLRVSSPKNNQAFSPTSILRQSLDNVERATNQQRRQLRVYQEGCNQLIMGLIKAGPDARGKVRG